MTRALAVVAWILLVGARVGAQEATLDVLDGETLYEGGWLVTLAGERETRDELRSGSHSVPDPLRRRAEFRDTALAVHHGLRHDLQLSLLLPRVDRSLRLAPAGATPTRLSVQGPGDAVAVAKWRFHRADAQHMAWNNALLVGVEMPTGDDDARDAGLRLPQDLQPGSGSWNPLIGVASTYEPGRWRFNAVALYRHGGGGGEQETGDALFAELAVGNRFWLEPYPGPFMRADLALRHRRDERIMVADDFLVGPPLANDPTERPSGGDLTTLAFNLAFRPRPSVDIQLEVERPLSEHLDGTDLEAETTVALRLGLRF